MIAARDCLNGDFDRAGLFTSRPGLTRESTQALHSLWTAPGGRESFAVSGTDLVRVIRTDAGVSTEPVAALPSSLPADFCELNGEIVYSTLDAIGVIGADGKARPLAPPDAAAPVLEDAKAGGLYGGRYSVAYAWLDARGQEGGLSPIATIVVSAGHGIRVRFNPAPPGAVAARVYRTGPNGNNLYRTTEVPASMTSFFIGIAREGRQADTAYLRSLPPGSFVRAWQGRLLTARGRTLYVSEPMRYGLFSPRHGFVRFPDRITFIEAVAGGVFVGQSETVLFLDGARPGDWSLRRTGGDRPVPHSSILVSSDLFAVGMELQDGDHALWLAANGYVLGTPTGQIVEPQARRIRLPAAAAGWTAMHDRRLFTLIT